eukprot:15433337-Alexandrium_andersonii.AAC.1
MAGTGIALPANDIISGRIRRVPPPMPPPSHRFRNQADLEHFKEWRSAKLRECFLSWTDGECICVPLVDNSARRGYPHFELENLRRRLGEAEAVGREAALMSTLRLLAVPFRSVDGFHDGLQ